MKIQGNIELSIGSTIKNLVAEALVTKPSAVTEGRIWYDSIKKEVVVGTKTSTDTNDWEALATKATFTLLSGSVGLSTPAGTFDTTINDSLDNITGATSLKDILTQFDVKLTSNASVKFEDLTNTPTTLSGKRDYILKVSTDETKLELVSQNQPITSIIGLTDTPSAMQDGKVLVGKIDPISNEQTMIWAPLNNSIRDNFTQLDDTPSLLLGNEHRLLRVDATGSKLEFATVEAVVPANVFKDLSDTPSTYGTTGQHLVSNGSSIVFETPQSIPSRIQDLTNVPTPVAGLYLKAAADGNSMEWVGQTAGVNSFYELSDTPNSYTNNDGKFLRVSGDSVIFDNLPTAPTTYPTFSSLTDTPQLWETNKWIKSSPLGESLIWVDAPPTGASDFVELNDTPSQLTGNNVGVSYTGGSTKFVLSDGSKLIYGDINIDINSAIDSYKNSITFTSLNDTPSTIGANKYLRGGSNGTMTWEALPGMINNLTELDDFGDTSLIANKWLKINADGTKFFQADLPTIKFTDNTDTPTNYFQSAGKVLVVNANANGIEYTQLTSANISDIPNAANGTDGQVLSITNGVYVLQDVNTATSIDDGTV